jgi:hypothetical protein
LRDVKHDCIGGLPLIMIKCHVAAVADRPIEAAPGGLEKQYASAFANRSAGNQVGVRLSLPSPQLCAIFLAQIKATV